MNIDLKENKTSTSETFDHLYTVLVETICDIERVKGCELKDKKYQEAKKYLKTYIEELIKQKI